MFIVTAGEMAMDVHSDYCRDVMDVPTQLEINTAITKLKIRTLQKW
jgi:hypothetical protein